jgi:hypothetical protein
MNIVPNDILNVARVFWWVTTFICIWHMYFSLSKQLKHTLEMYETFNWNRWNNQLKHWNRGLQHLKHGTCGRTPKLYGPHARVIVSTTSDCCARELENIRSMSGVLGKPKSSTNYNSHWINKGVTTILQHVLQNFTSEWGRI